MQNYHQNVDDVLSVYKDIIVKVCYLVISCTCTHYSNIRNQCWDQLIKLTSILAHFRSKEGIFTSMSSCNINPSASFTTHFRSMEMAPRKMYSLKSTRNYLQLSKCNPRTQPSKLLTCDVEDRSNGSAEEMSATATRWSPKWHKLSKENFDFV